jgi:outer membrane protein insertion porin family
MDFKRLAGVLPLLFAASVWAVEPFVIKDIRVEGIQRTEAGTVFSYLPVKVGDTLDDERATASLHALFMTGFFKDVELKADQGVLVVVVKERPTVDSVEINGVKDFPKDQLAENLKMVGLGQGRILDKSVLDKAVQELKRQYIARGKYAVEVKATVKELERNRVEVSLDVTEGEASKIRRINIVGNRNVAEDELLDMMKLSTPGLFSWFTKNDQYSKQKLSADIESIRTFYMNSGYMDFAVESTQVSISPDKNDIFITLNIAEGEKYTFSKISVAGSQTVVTHDEVRKLIAIQPGDVFSREVLTESNRKISERLGEDGYAFANVNPIPEVDKEKHQVAFTFVVDPLQRTYVRHINISGNEKTRDEVIRRELRQMEGGWFASSKIKKSKQRIDRLDFFEEVNLETVPVQGTNDQMDVNFSVREKSTGNFQIGAGYGSDGFTFSGSVTQANLFGTGNYLSTQINTSSVNQVYSISYTNPYYTDDGISRGFDLYKRRTNTTSTYTSEYYSNTLGAGVRYGVPTNDDEAFQYGISAEKTELTLTDSSPQRYIDYINTFGDTTSNLLGTIGWTRDTRDSAIYTTEGSTQRAFIEASTPVSAQRFYKLSYAQQWFHALSPNLTLRLNGELGYADGYSGMQLPFFKNLYAGGNSSVRGYDYGSLGPRDSSGNSLGGNRRVVGNAEVLFPFPGMEKEKSVRWSAFLDGGAIYGDGGQVPGSMGMRYSMGLGVIWFSPAGPIQISWSKALNDQPQDKLRNFDFSIGTTF